MKHFYLKGSMLCALILLAVKAFSASAPSLKAGDYKAPPAFIENRGQVADVNGLPVKDVLFYTRMENATVYFMKDRMIYLLQKNNFKKTSPVTEMKGMPQHPEIESVEYHRVDVIYKNANAAAEIIPGKRNTGYYNFYLPHCDQGLTMVATYNQLRYKNIYPNIDMVFTNTDGGLKYDIILNEGAVMSDLQLSYEGADQLDIDKKGVLRITTRLGTISDKIPYSYTETAKSRTPLAINWAKKDKLISFSGKQQTGAGARTVIDPSLTFQVFHAGSNYDYATDIDLVQGWGPPGAINLGGYATSTNLPTTSGYIQTAHAGYIDAFVARYDGSGSFVWGTYYGGTGDDRIFALESPDVLMSGNVCATGQTQGGLPLASNSFNGGSYDAFVLHFSPAGILYGSRYYGDAGDNAGYAIETDPGAYVFVGGYNLDIGYFDLYGANLVASRNIGGMVTDLEYDYNSGCLYVAGTGTTTAALSPSPLQSSPAGADDVFIVKLYILGTPLTNASKGTYFGGSGDEVFPRIAVYQTVGSFNTDVYLTFTTNSSDLNIYCGSNAYKKAFIDPFGNLYMNQQDAFVAVFDEDFTQAKYGSYIGGHGDGSGFYQASDMACDIQVDLFSNFYVYGITGENSFPYYSSNTAVFGMGPASSSVPQYFLTKFNPGYQVEFSAYVAECNSGGSWRSYTAWYEPSRMDLALLDCDANLVMSGSSFISGSAPISAFYVQADISPQFYLYQQGTLTFTGSPITLSIPPNPFISNIQWYFNGSPIPGANGLIYVAEEEGVYYATLDYCNGTPLTSNEVALSIPCEIPEFYLYYTDKYTAPAGISTITSVGLPQYYGEITVPAGAELHITDVDLIFTECGRILVEDGGILIINSSHLIACDEWQGIQVKSDAVFEMNKSSIRHARIGIYLDGTNTSFIVNSSKFRRNGAHVVIANEMQTFKVLKNNVFYHLADIGCWYENVFDLGSVPLTRQVYITKAGSVLLEKNEFLGYDNKGPRTYYAIQLEDAGDITVSSNTFRGEFDQVITSNKNSVSPNNINANYFDDVWCNYGMKINTDPDIRITYNTFTSPGATTGGSFGISMNSCDNIRCQANNLTDYDMGIEWYNATSNGFSYIEGNTMSRCRQGITVSYFENPVNATGLMNYGYSHQMPLWIRCNTLSSCELGIAGTGFMPDQVINPFIPAPQEESAGNQFINSIDWDMIWDNWTYWSLPAFTYYIPVAAQPNLTTPCSPRLMNMVSIVAPTLGISPLIPDFIVSSFNSFGQPIQANDCSLSSFAARHTALNNIHAATGNDINIVPNPVHGSFRIDLSEAGQASNMTITDILGRTVYESNIANEHVVEINSSEWENGVYLVQLKDKDRTLLTKKLLKAD